MDTERRSQELKAVLEAKLQPFVRQVVESFGIAGLTRCRKWRNCSPFLILLGSVKE